MENMLIENPEFALDIAAENEDKTNRISVNKRSSAGQIARKIKLW
jgi:hypothetical protein